MKQMIDWALEVWRILPDEITYIKYGPYTDLPVCPRNLENAEPVDGIQEEMFV